MALVLAGLGCRELHGPSEPGDGAVDPALVGQVLDPEGDPLAEARVVLYREVDGGEDYGFRLETESDGNGFFFFRILPDTFSLYIDPPDWSPLPDWKERGVVFQPGVVRPVAFVGREIRGTLQLTAVPDSLARLDVPWTITLGYPHRWPSGRSETLRFTYSAQGDSFRIQVPARSRYQAVVASGCCPPLDYSYEFPDSIEPGPDGRVDLEVPFRRRSVEITLEGGPLPEGRIELRGDGQADSSVDLALATDGERTLFSALVYPGDTRLWVHSDEGPLFLPRSLEVDGGDPLQVDLGPHEVRVRAETPEGFPLDRWDLQVYPETGGNLWISVSGAVSPPIHLPGGGIEVYAFATSFHSATRYVEITGDRTLTLVLQPRD